MTILDRDTQGVLLAYLRESDNIKDRDTQGYCWHIKGRVTISKTGTLSIAGTVRMLVSLLFDRPRRIPFPGSSALHCSSRCSSSTSWSDEECAERAVPLLAIPLSLLQSHSFSPFNTSFYLLTPSAVFPPKMFLLAIPAMPRRKGEDGVR